MNGDVTQLSATAEVSCLCSYITVPETSDFKPNGIVSVCSWIGGSASKGPRPQAHRTVMRA